MAESGLIFDIKRYSINDGPGIRVTVFLKGCPLSCTWCHNPESQSPKIQKLYTSSRCIGCGKCVEACPDNALMLTPGSGIVTDFEQCNLCGNCADVCPSRAMEISGSQLSIDEIMIAIRKETLLMDTSSGGVTFSGGEPLQHPDLLVSLLKACGNEGIHRAVDTSGYAKWEILRKVSAYTDLFLYDIKHMDPEMHKQFTGVSNDLILDNLKLLAGIDCKIAIRIPLIEGFNTDKLNISRTAAFIAALPENARTVQLLPYHNIASKKYEKLGGYYNPGHLSEPSEKTISNCMEIFNAYGLSATIGG